MTTDRHPAIVGLLLAGGKGTRMGGQDKGLLPWQGQPMANRVCQALRSVTPRVYISANRSLEQYQQLAPGRVLQDPETYRHQGPLAGLLSGLRAAASEGASGVLVCPCDTPGITPATLSRLISAWQSQPERPAIAENEGRIHPLHGVYPVSIMASLQQWLDSGNRRVMGFAESVRAVTVDCPEAGKIFKNRNKPEDLT